MLEIGFNAGHSATTLLASNPNASLISFDLGFHRYVHPAKQYIDKDFASRHTLILGDSQKTIPEYFAQNPDVKFDLIFIDGGHEYEISMNDLVNCGKMAHKDTILIIDDILYGKENERPWSIGPTRAWTELIEKGVVEQTEYKHFATGIGQAVGKYKF